MHEEPAKIPRHVAVIMDGNGRWANARGKPRHAGHRAGVKSVRATVERAAECGVDYLTLFAFSSENWGRPAEEVSKLMGLFVEALRREVDELHRNNVKLRFVGALEQLSDGLQKKIAAAEAKTAGNAGLQVNVWGVNNADFMQQQLDKGSTAIITDEPAVLAELLGETQ